jgi:hypothetical protein
MPLGSPCAAQPKKIKICDIYNKIYRAGRSRKFSAPTFPKIYDEPILFLKENKKDAKHRVST